MVVVVAVRSFAIIADAPMRALIVVLLAACGGSGNPDCPQVARSEIEHTADEIASGTNRIAISWTRSFSQSRPEIHGALVGPDGTIGPDISLPQPSMRAAIGTTTALWATREPCAGPVPFPIILQKESGAVVFVDTAMKTTGRAMVFDGSRYHVFWTTDTIIKRMTIEEDGTLGAAQMLGVTGMCVDAASDGAGTTFLRVDNRGYIVAANGDTRVALTSAQPIGNGGAFYFAGKFHVFNDNRLLSIAPDSTGAYTERFLDGDLTGAREFYPAVETLFVKAFTGLVEVDAAFATKRELSISTVFPMGTFGADLVRFEHTPLDVDTMQPGHIDLIRENAWKKEVAVDSPVRFEDACEPVDF